MLLVRVRPVELILEFHLNKNIISFSNHLPNVAHTYYITTETYLCPIYRVIFF